MEMNRTLTNLSQVMTELEVGKSVNTLDERVTAHKAVYLARVIGSTWATNSHGTPRDRTAATSPRTATPSPNIPTATGRK